MDVWNWYYIAVSIQGYVSKLNENGYPIKHTDDESKALKFECVNDMRMLIDLGYSIIRK